MSGAVPVYGEVAALNSERHGAWTLDTGFGFGFMAQSNAALLTAVEFPRACREYPIVFAADGGDVYPAAVLGLRDCQNLFVDAAGAWQADYVPAYVRRYPFILAGGGQDLTVCIDEAFAGFNRDRGERLFLDDGGRSPYLQGVIAFLQEYQAHHELTQALCRRLAEWELLEPMQANVAMDDGARMSLTGFMVVGRERLKSLSTGRLARLMASDELELVYAHLASLDNFSRLLARMGGKAQA